MATKYLVQHRRGTAAQWEEKNTIIPKEGEIVIEIDEVNSLHKLKIGDGTHTYSELAYLQAGDEIVTQVIAQTKPRVVTVELTSNWNQGEDGKYNQVIALDNITKYSRLDLQPDANMLAEFKQLGLVFVTENNGGTITVYSVGNMPLKSYTMQATIIETECNEQDMSVVGIPVGISHTHDNKDALDSITTDDIANWNSTKNTVTKLTTVSNEDDFREVFEITESGTYMTTIISGDSSLVLTHQPTNPNKKFVAKVYFRVQAYEGDYTFNITGNYPIKYLRGEPNWSDSYCWVLDIEFDNQCSYFLVDAKYAGSETVLTKVSELENDSDYQNSNQVQEIVSAAIANTGHAVFQMADPVPSAEYAESNVLYLVPNGDKLDIYAKISGEMICIDDTDADLSGYVTDEELNTVVENMYTKDEIDNMIGILSSIVDETLNYDITEGGE